MNKTEFTKHRLLVCVETVPGDIARNTKTRRTLVFCRDARFVGRDGLRAHCKKGFPEHPKLMGRRRIQRGKFYWEMWSDLGREVGF